MNISDTNA